MQYFSTKPEVVTGRIQNESNVCPGAKATRKKAPSLRKHMNKQKLKILQREKNIFFYKLFVVEILNHAKSNGETLNLRVLGQKVIRKKRRKNIY